MTSVEHDGSATRSDTDGGRETRTTVAIALIANLVIAIAKLVGGLLSGSVAMLAEASHSLADTANQVFLAVSLSLGSRPADEEHPFGYGKERFFWAFLAAAFIFVAGAVFSWGEGIRGLFGGGGDESFLIAYVVLAVAFVAEGTSLVRDSARRPRKPSAAGRSVRRHLRVTRDPTVKVVVMEDSAAVIGILLAAAGIGLHQLTGDHRWDAAASIAIGCLLAGVAFRLGRDNKDLLLGEAALAGEREAMRRAIRSHDDVVQVMELLTMATGPHSLLVAVRAELRDGMQTAEIQELCGRIEESVRQAVPDVSQFFFDPTPPARDTPSTADG